MYVCTQKNGIDRDDDVDELCKQSIRRTNGPYNPPALDLETKVRARLCELTLRPCC
jgi:hypothetical protein